MQRIFAVPATSLLLAASCLGADWLTDGGDVPRNNWQRDETTLTTANVKDLKLLWKIKLDNEPRQMHSLLEPLVIARVDTKNGPKQLVIQAGVSDNVYAIDVATGELLWKRKFESTFKEAPGTRGPSVLCPGGMTANVTIGPGASAGKYIIYAASWDGRLHQLNAADGEYVTPPAKFMPPNGKPYALSLYKNVIYTHSAQGCGGNPEHGVHVRPGDAQGRQLGSGWRRHVGTIRSRHQQEGRDVYGDGRRPLGSGKWAVRKWNYRCGAESDNQSCRTRWIITVLRTPNGSTNAISTCK